MVIRVCDVVYRSPRTNDQAASWRVAAVLKEVTDRYSSFESCGVAGAELRDFIAFDQGDFAVKNVDQLVFRAVPMLDGRTGTGLKHLDEGAELGQRTCFTNPEHAVRRWCAFSRAFFRNEAVRSDDWREWDQS